MACSCSRRDGFAPPRARAACAIRRATLGKHTQIEPETDRRRPARMEVDLAKKSDSTAAAKSKPVVIVLDEAEPDTLRTIGGSRSDKFNNALID